MKIIEFPKEEKINFNIFKRDFDKTERLNVNKLNKFKNLSLPFEVEKFQINYNFFRIDHHTNIIMYDFEIFIKRVKDGFDVDMFKKYEDIIMSNQLTEEQLIRKRKMQLEIQKSMTKKNREGIINTLIKNNFLFPFVVDRYWLKMFLYNFDMGIVFETPIVKLKGKFIISLEHFMKDLYRFKYAKITDDLGSMVLKKNQKDSIYKTSIIEMNYKLPKLFFVYSYNNIKQIIEKVIQEDFNIKFAPHKFLNFWYYVLKSKLLNNIYDMQVSWKDDRRISLLYRTSFSEDIDKMSSAEKTIAKTTVGAIAGIELLKILNKNSKFKKYNIWF